MFAQSCFWRAPELELVILRPANILGTVRNAPSNYLRLTVVTTRLGFDPMIQMVHLDDVVSAIELALNPGVRGVFNVAGPPPVPLSKALRILERKTVSVPYTVARGGLAGLFRLGISQFPAPELDFIRYVCMVDDGAARTTLGFKPEHDLHQTLASVDEERWV
jgi:UDP-glucose 4-epimerase